MLLGVQQTAEIVSGKNYMYPHRSTYEQLVTTADCGVSVKTRMIVLTKCFMNFCILAGFVLSWYTISFIFTILKFHHLVCKTPMHSSVKFTSYQSLNMLIITFNLVVAVLKVKNLYQTDKTKSIMRKWLGYRHIRINDLDKMKSIWLWQEQGRLNDLD